MSDKKFRRSAGKGYYIALILCAAAIGITSYVFNRNEDTVLGPEASAPAEQVDIPVLATQPNAQAAATEAPLTQEVPVLKTTSPVVGQEVFGYSMEALS